MHTTPTRPVIRATGLRKSFGGTVVPDGVDLDVPERTVLAVLGPNWAGMTSIVRILSTLTRADAGRAFRWQELTPPAATWSLHRHYSVLLCTSSQ
jgi:ABC-2 type transport system ATP-binding protein